MKNKKNKKHFNRHWSPKVWRVQRGQYLLTIELGCYKWYQSQHRTMCQPSHCSLKGVDMRQCASKDTGPQRGWIWWQSHVDWRKERVSARTLSPEGGWCLLIGSWIRESKFILSYGKEEDTLYMDSWKYLSAQAFNHNYIEWIIGFFFIWILKKGISFFSCNRSSHETKQKTWKNEAEWTRSVGVF